MDKLFDEQSIEFQSKGNTLMFNKSVGINLRNIFLYKDEYTLFSFKIYIISNYCARLIVFNAFVIVMVF